MEKRLLFRFLFFSMSFFSLSSQRSLSTTQVIQAGFTARETSVTVYANGFDRASDLDLWHVKATNSTKTWQTGKSQSYYLPDFNEIDETSSSSLVIRYDDKIYSDERISSPLQTVEQNMVCSFYAAFDGVFIKNANLQVSVYDEDAKTSEILLDANDYSIANDLTRPKWIRFEYSLQRWIGKQVRICFHYKGVGGDDVLVDDFRIEQKDESEQATVRIDAGDQVHFINNSEGEYWNSEWVFEGGTPASSTDDEPVVTYPTPGVYAVTLTVSNNKNSSTITRERFILVSGKAPVAQIGYPEGTYTEASFFDRFVPSNTELIFNDCSDNMPFARSWYFQNAENEYSADKSPAVRYTIPGQHKVTLTSTNDLGSSTQEVFVKVGGESDVCNFSREESEMLDVIDLGFYGYYGGTNWLDMPDFAEFYENPVTPVTISAVKVYFSKAEAISGDAPVTVSVCSEEGGLPGRVLVSTSLPASQLYACTDRWIPTVFLFETPVVLEKAFFITFGGIPNEDNGTQADDIAVAAVRRKPGEKCTAYHNLALLDDQLKPTGETQWYKNEDEAVSFAVLPVLKFNDQAGTAIKEVKEKSEIVRVYTPDGIYRGSYPESVVADKLSAGCYILKGKGYVRKILID